MEGGIGWWKQIEEAIDHVDFLIMVVTPAALSSEFALKEWRRARQQGVRVLPVFGVDKSTIDLSLAPAWAEKVHIYELAPEEYESIRSVPGSLEDALQALENDHEFLLEGGVFTRDLIDTWIGLKQTKEIDEVRLRPTPHEYFLYFDV